jgi:hypothetical protein
LSEPVEGSRDAIGPGPVTGEAEDLAPPVATSWAAVVNSRNQRRRSSQSRALPVRSSFGIQADRARAICTISSHTLFCAVRCGAGCAGRWPRRLGSGPPHGPVAGDEASAQSSYDWQCW